jgi:hypothetical protein
MRTPLTSLASSILTPHDCDRPDPDDPAIQAIAKEYGLPADKVADIAEETALTIFTRTGERAPIEDVINAMHVAIHERAQAHLKKLERKRRKR